MCLSVWKHNSPDLLSTSGSYACSSPAGHAITHQDTAEKQQRVPAATVFIKH